MEGLGLVKRGASALESPPTFSADLGKLSISSSFISSVNGLNMCLHLIWPSSQTSRCRCGVAHFLRFQDGKVQQDHVDGVVSEVVVRSGLEVTVKEQPG